MRRILVSLTMVALVTLMVVMAVPALAQEPDPNANCVARDVVELNMAAGFGSGGATLGSVATMEPQLIGNFATDCPSG